MGYSNQRVTIYDIAERLGLSPSTVNRAINDKSCINESTREKVKKVALEMGYKTNKVAKSLTQKPIRIGFVMREAFLGFQNEVMEGAQAACAQLLDYNVFGEFYIVKAEDVRRSLSEKMLEISEMELDGIIYNASSDTGMEDTLSAIRDKGIVLATVTVDDLSDKVLFSVTANARRAGRIAADLLAHAGLGPGSEVGIFVGGKQHPLHREYLHGFDEMNKRTKFDVIKIIEHHDNANIAYFAAEQFFVEYPTVSGVYASTAVTVPICKRIKDAGLSGKIKLIGTDLTEEHIPFLEDGTIVATLFQDPFQMGYKAFMKMYDYLSKNWESRRNIYINPEIVVRGNLDYYTRHMV